LKIEEDYTDVDLGCVMCKGTIEAYNEFILVEYKGWNFYLHKECLPNVNIYEKIEAAIKEELKEIASKLGEKGAVKRATNIIINYLKYEPKGKST